jgi:hypothetical protein
MYFERSYNEFYIKLLNGEQVLDNQRDIKQHIEQHYQQLLNGIPPQILTNIEQEL